MAPKRGKERGRFLLSNGLGILLSLLALVLLYLMISREPTYTTLKYGELVQILTAARHDQGIVVQRVKVGHADIRGDILCTDQVSDGKDNSRSTQSVSFRTRREGLDTDLKLHDLLKETVGSSYQGEDEESALKSAYPLFTMLILLGAAALVGLLLVRWISGGSPLSFGRSRAKLYAQKDTAITFRDVAGIDEAVAELREVVDFLKTPEKYQALGGRIPKGVLLVGPPGTGKTLLAKAVAGEAEAPFFSLSGSDFVEMFVGVGAARVRDLFSQAEIKAPAIIFIDELDALGKTRTGAALGGHDEREQTLNQLLVEMDGFDSNRGVIIMAATNRPETLDAALLRPGRFDRTVVVDRPDINGREAILKVHVRNVRVDNDVDLRRVASLTPGSVGADLANLVNEAALMAARAGKETVTMREFDEAVERGAVGLERKSRIMSPTRSSASPTMKPVMPWWPAPCPTRTPFTRCPSSRAASAPGIRAEPTRRGSLPGDPDGTGESDSRGPGRDGGRGADLPRDQQRSDQRPGAVQPHRPRHGQGVRHEPARPGPLPGQGASAIPQWGRIRERSLLQ